MAIAPLPSFSLPSADLRSFPPSSRSQDLHLQRSTTIPHLARRSFCCFGRKSRRGGASKSNKELCDELRQFIAVMGLPERQLPYMRELCINGRKDLANIVRRRGYKAITKLLLNSNEENDSEQTSERNQDPISAELYEATGEDSELYQDLASEVLEEHDQNDIDRFKSLLLQRVMKLSQLKQQIEDEERAMCNLEARAAVNLDDIQRIIAEKDVELCAAEEHLNGLKEVHIDYWENGQIVEVAGSFNGWQHRVTMDLHTSSEHVDPPTSSGLLQYLSDDEVCRKQCLWSTVLWLFPGVFEIKFIVDGHWKIDPRREIITSGGITNNVLVVDG